MQRMSEMRSVLFAVVVAAVAAIVGGGGCSGSPPRSGAPGGPSDKQAMKIPAGGQEAFGPLEVGADYATYSRVTDEPFRSLDHGNRWVHVYVNPVGVEPYLAGVEIPVGTIVVKTSVQNVDGKPSDIEGPIFVMEKRAKGYAPDHDDWWYAIHWAKPPEDDAKKFGGPIYWRGTSSRVAYCWKCHDDYSNSLGGLVPSSLLPR